MPNNSNSADLLLNENCNEWEQVRKAIQDRKLLLEFMAVILTPEDNIRMSKLLKEKQTRVVFKFLAEGTANSELMDLLGIGTSHKIVYICITPEFHAAELMKLVTREFKLRVRGNGIAFTVPISGSSTPLFKLLDHEAVDAIRKCYEQEVNKMKNEAMYELILSVVNPGYSEDLMHAAKEVGATGGTVFHSRQIGDGAEKVLGITLQGEREIVAILTEKTGKVAIMRAINAKFGIASEARGITISLPVSSVAGLEE